MNIVNEIGRAMRRLRRFADQLQLEFREGGEDQLALGLRRVYGRAFTGFFTAILQYPILPNIAGLI
jgi:hypothetical protein